MTATLTEEAVDQIVKKTVGDSIGTLREIKCNDKKALREALNDFLRRHGKEPVIEKRGRPTVHDGSAE